MTTGTQSFRIQSVSTSLALEFVSAVGAESLNSDWIVFEVALVNGPVTARVEVHDLSAKAWRDYFSDLSANWKGWKEDKCIESIEPGLRLTSSCDSLGHVTMCVRIEGVEQTNLWAAESCLEVEVGALSEIAQQAGRFFQDRGMKSG
jgi:hypothetical protein